MVEWLHPTTSMMLLGADAPGRTNLLQFLFPFLVIGLLFYFLMIRPEKRKRAEEAKMRDALKKNDHVITVGGIFGVVVNAQAGSGEVTLRVDDSTNTRIRVLRSSILRVVTDEKADQKKDDA